MFDNLWQLCLLLSLTSISYVTSYYVQRPLVYKKNPAPDGHRCGICPTHFRKICAIDTTTHATMLFDNHCVMDLYNCLEGTDFMTVKYDKCVYFGNFAYVHGFKKEDLDYGEDHLILHGSQKNPDFV